MTKVKLCSRAAALGLAFVAVVCEARDLEPVDLLERHIEARGGRSALEQVQYVERFGSFHAHAGANKIAGTYHTCLKYPDHVAISIDAGPIQMHQILIENVGLECQKGIDSCGSASRAVHEELSETARIANREELFEKIPAADAVEWIEHGLRGLSGRQSNDNDFAGLGQSDGPALALVRKRFWQRFRPAGALGVIPNE